MGTIIAERVLDLVVLLGITTTAFLIASTELITMFRSSFNSILEKFSWVYILVTVLAVVGVIFLLSYLLKKTKLYKKLKQFAIGLKEGFATIWTMEKKLLYLLHTLFIWAMYLAMFYVCFYSVSEFQGIAIAPVLSAFVAGSFSVAFINGGFGAYPYLIAQVLSFYGYAETLGTSIGWILWLSQTVLVIVYGAISLLLISSNKSLFSK